MKQCSPSVKSKVEGNTGYSTARESHNCKWLLTTLKQICQRFEEFEFRALALVNAKIALYTCRQHTHQTTAQYYDTFKELAAVLESFGGVVHDTASAVENCIDLSGADSDNERNESLRELYLATIFIRNADPQRFEALQLDLYNDFSKGTNNYPTNLESAYKRLLTCRLGQKRQTNPRHSFNSSNQQGRGGDSSDHPPRNPGRGGGRGDQRPDAPKDTRSARAFSQVGFTMAHVENHFPDGIPTHFILLDSDSTVSIFCNHHLLTDIHDVDEILHLETNGGGHQTTCQQGTLPTFGTVWYNPDSIANILSLADVTAIRRVTMDSAKQRAFLVHSTDGSRCTIFKQHASGLYLHDASDPNDSIVLSPNTSNSEVIGYSYLQTVTENKLAYTKRQIDAADAARALYRHLGRPGRSHFLDILKQNHIINCPVTINDAIRAEAIYGRDVAYLKGKTTASPATNHIPDQPPVSLSMELLSAHPNVTLCFDLFYVLGLTFCLSTSRDIHFLSCRPIPNRNKATLRACIQADIDIYLARGFLPTAIHADGEFHALQPLFPNITFSICPADGHVPEIERAIRTVKETIRSTVHGMPYHSLPHVLVQELAKMAVCVYNTFPHNDGISSTLSPASIVTGAPKLDFTTLKLEFGTYVQVYDGTSNDTKSRTLPAIATNPTGNSSGDYYFMSLLTGRRIHRRSWTVLPISDYAISLVEARALEENMPSIDTAPLVNEYDPDAIADPAIYDHDFIPHSDNDSDHILTSDAYTDSDSSDDDDDADIDDIGHHPVFDDVPADNAARAIQPPENEERTSQPPENEERTIQTPENEERTIQTPENEERTIHPPKEVERTVQNPENAACPVPTAPTPPVPQSPPPSRPPGLRPSHKPSYSYRFGFAQAVHYLESVPPVHKAPAPAPSLRKAIFGLLFTQMSANKGLKKHGMAAYNALRKEFEQFRALDVLEPLDAFTISDDLKKEALRPHSVIKEKRDGILKGRTCADGRPQRGKYTKAETGSPTLAPDALFLTLLIDAFEGRDVAIADIAGAYLHAFMKDFTALRFTGWAVDLLCDVNPHYSEFVVYEGTVKVLYVRCNKAIYGCVVSGMLWYETFSSTLEKHGFSINPYDFCVANATIEGSQCTIAWYVDDTKISHKKPSVVSHVLHLLEQDFGKLTVSRGKRHSFLGMNLLLQQRSHCQHHHAIIP